MKNPLNITEKAYSAAKNTAPAVADRMGITGEVQVVGGALVMVLLVVYVLNEIYASVDVGTGPFSDVATDLETTGAAALGLLVIAILVIAASAIMRMFGGGGFASR